MEHAYATMLRIIDMLLFYGNSALWEMNILEYRSQISACLGRNVTIVKMKGLWKITISTSALKENKIKTLATGTRYKLYLYQMYLNIKYTFEFLLKYLFKLYIYNFKISNSRLFVLPVRYPPPFFLSCNAQNEIKPNKRIPLRVWICII